MSFAENPSQSPFETFGMAASADADARATFIRKTYTNLSIAVAGFAGVCALLLQFELTRNFCDKMLQNPMMFLLSIGGMMVAGWIADKWATNSTSREMQYAGLALYTIAEAIFFLPLLYLAHFYVGKDVIPTAGILTLTVFGGLTLTVLVFRTDFSFLRAGLSIAGFAAIGLILCSMVFGMSLGLWFSVAMVVLAAGYILYYTSNILHHYPTTADVAAALALFASLATLFWYILHIVMAFSGDD